MPQSVRDRFTVDFEPIYFFTKQAKYYFEQQFEPHLTTPTINNQTRQERKEATDKDKSSDFFGNAPQGFDGKPIGYGVNGRNMRTVWDVPTRPSPVKHFAMYPETLVERMLKAGCPEFVCSKCGKARVKEYQTTRNRTPLKEDSKTYQTQQGGKRSSTLMSGNSEIVLKGYTDCGCGADFVSGVVLDPFAGAGNTLTTAIKHNRSAIGIELYDEYCEIACQRVEEEKQKTSLFNKVAK
jgi:hypothetical protein